MNEARLIAAGEAYKTATTEADAAYAAAVSVAIEEGTGGGNLKRAAELAGVARASVYNELGRRQQHADALAEEVVPEAPADRDEPEFGDLTRDEQVAILALSSTLSTTGLGFLDSVEQRVPTFAAPTASGTPQRWGRRRLIAALASLNDRNLIVRHGRRHQYDLHHDGRELVRRYYDRVRAA